MLAKRRVFVLSESLFIGAGRVWGKCKRLSLVDRTHIGSETLAELPEQDYVGRYARMTGATAGNQSVFDTDLPGVCVCVCVCVCEEKRKAVAYSQDSSRGLEFARQFSACATCCRQ